MKNLIISFLITLISLSCFAGGIGAGGGQGDKLKNFSMKAEVEMQSALKSSGQMPNQVYYLKHKQAEIQFATNVPGDSKVEIQSLRPEEISNQALLEGLKRSQQSRQWEKVKPLSGIELDQSIKNLNLNRLK